MIAIKHILLFMKNNAAQLRRKWLSLPLLFIFPFVLVGLVLFIITTFIIPNEKQAIQVGLVDLDQSSETEMVTQLIEQSSQLGEYINIRSMTEEEGKHSIAKNEISAYIVFPENFTTNLYHGQSVELPIIGNPQQQMESLLIRGIMDSVSRHIRSSQANILTINHYAKELGMNDNERNDLVFEQFKEFVFYTLGSNQIVNEKKLSNLATTSPMHYFGVSTWFILLTIWLFIIFNYLFTDNQLNMKQRMRLYGVTELQQITARMIVTLISVCVFVSFLSVIYLTLVNYNLVWEDYLKIVLLMALYSVTLLTSLSLIEVLTPSKKIRLVLQSAWMGMGLLISGAIIPVIYYPLWLQNILSYSFTYEAFYWLIEIILNQRNYTDFLPITLMSMAAICLLVGVSLWKERVQA